jgi:iron-sulfur cluster assembly accessory protein
VIDLTPSAAGKLQSILTEKGLTGYGLRVYVSGSGCCGMQYGMGFDKARDGDTLETVLGMQVLVDSASAQYLDGVKIDFNDTPDGGFMIENPNQAAGCGDGCGDGGHREGGCCH